jgi:hypothetical protein
LLVEDEEFDDEEEEEDLLAADAQGEIYFYLVVNAEWARVHRGQKLKGKLQLHYSYTQAGSAKVSSSYTTVTLRPEAQR